MFENVCHHGMASGTAIGELKTRNAHDTARLTVQFVADFIAMKERL